MTAILCAQSATVQSMWVIAGHVAKAQSIVSKALKAGAQPAAELEALLADLQSGTLTLAHPAQVSTMPAVLSAAGHGTCSCRTVG